MAHVVADSVDECKQQCQANPLCAYVSAATQFDGGVCGSPGKQCCSLWSANGCDNITPRSVPYVSHKCWRMPYFTASPSSSPSESPTTVSPTESPTTEEPTEVPSEEPTESPTTVTPTGSPTESPTTATPTVSPTESPTTVSPTEAPTESPTTVSPTESPTESPTTVSPTESPTDWSGGFSNRGRERAVINGYPPASS